MAMKKAMDAMMVGDQDAFDDAYLQAAAEVTNLPGKLTADERIAASFKGMKLLRTPDGQDLSDDQLQRLEKHIGFDAYDKLTYYDMMLEEASRGVLMPRQ